MASSAAEDEAASQALIARLIAEDCFVGPNFCPIGGSVEDYEDPLSSYERGLIEDPDNVNNGPDGTTTWGDPLVTDPNEGSPSADASHGGATGEGWDAGVADGFEDDTPNTNFGEHGEQVGPSAVGTGRSASHHLSNELYEQLNTERPSLAQTVSVPGLVPRQSFERPREISDPEAVTTNIASLPTQPESPPRKEYIGYIMPAGTQVPSRPATPLDSRRKGSDPPCLETPSSQTSNPPSPAPRPTHMVHIPDKLKFLEKSKAKHPVEEPKKNIPDAEAKVANTGFPPTQPDSPPRREYIGYSIGPAGAQLPPPPGLTEEEEIGRAIVWPRPTRFNSKGNPVEWSVPDPIHRPSAFDRHTGLDVNFSYSNCIDEKEAFDNFNEHERDEDEYNKAYQAFLKDNLKKGSGLGGDEGEDSCSPWIYIPFLGRCGGSFSEVDARTEDNKVIEIRLGDDDLSENILGDIANSKSPDGTYSAPLSGTQPSNVQGEFDQDFAFKRVEAPKEMRAREEAWARCNQCLPQMPRDQELTDDELEEPGHEVHEQVLELNQDKAENGVGISEETPGETHEPRTLRGGRTMAILRWLKGEPPQPGDKIFLDAKPREWRRAWGYNKDLAHERATGQIPGKMEEVNTWDEVVRQVVDDQDKADDEHEDVLKKRREQREEQPKDDEEGASERSLTREEHTTVQKRVATEAEMPRGRPLERKREEGSEVVETQPNDERATKCC